ncbi:hypothetical protein [Bradyrhizobium sp. 930_D9_N1_4]|uniref:hypothetical protein n=1 Tax=Bradyrhizobium sp. 930_D9_N1_4 TaxID=3240374 RepID=UPI003F8A8069
MHVAIALVLGVLLFAAFMVGLFWALVVMVPFYACVGLAIYFVWKSARTQANVTATLQREAERQRSFNEQEMRAWNASIEKNRRNATKRERALRRFDQTRDAPQNATSPP